MEDLGAECKLEPLGEQTLPDGKKIPLPDILLGTLGKDPNKKTLLVYGHLDVQPAEKVSVTSKLQLTLSKETFVFTCLMYRSF